MIEVDIDPKMVELAKSRSEEMGVLNNSVTRGDGNIAGFVGEYIIKDFIKGSEIADTYDYDVVTRSGVKIDVKTKRTTVRPKPYYDCTIYEYNTKQKCDVYAFVRVSEDYTKGWILGFYPKKKYFENAKFHKKGDIDGDNNFRFKANSYNLPISQLKVPNLTEQD